MRKALAAATALALALPASVAVAQQDMPTIIVTAPRTLSDEKAERWRQFNKDAAKIEARLANLYDERRDDISDVKEARDDYEDAKDRLEDTEDKLEDEQKDMRRTAKDIEKAERKLRDIARRRARLR